MRADFREGGASRRVCGDGFGGAIEETGVWGSGGGWFPVLGEGRGAGYFVSWVFTWCCGSKMIFLIIRIISYNQGDSKSARVLIDGKVSNN